MTYKKALIWHKQWHVSARDYWNSFFKNPFPGLCLVALYSSVIRRHHIYAHAPLKSHSRAEENPTMTLHSLAWPDPSLRRGFIICSIYVPASDKRPARIYIGPGYERLSFAVAVVENNTSYRWTWVSNHFSTMRFVFEEKRHNQN